MACSMLGLSGSGCVVAITQTPNAAITEALTALDGIQHAFFTRRGGVSAGRLQVLVLDTRNEPIPGLFAAGNVAAAPTAPLNWQR